MPKCLASKNRLIKFVSFCFLSLFLFACADENDDSADDGLPPVAKWELVWGDEFNGTALNTDNWEIQLGDGKIEGISGWGNNELQYYSADNITVENGNLVISSKADGFVVADPANDPYAFNANYDFTSGRIRTQGKFDFTYGRIEARIKMPATKGLWNAFWLLGSDPSPYTTWAAKGELDILELWVRGDGVTTFPFASGAVHYGGTFPFNRFVSDGFDPRDFVQQTIQPIDFFTDFHVFALEWDEESIRWYIDGINYFSVKTTNFWSYFTDLQDSSAPADANDTIKYSSLPSEGLRGFQAAEKETAPFDSLFHIILNTAVGGNLPDSANEFPTDLTVAGDEMLVDYVRVYQCNLPEAGGARCKNNLGRRGIELPADPSDPSKTIIPNYTDEPLAAQSVIDDLFSIEFDLYTDGPNAAAQEGNTSLVIEGFNGAQWENVLDSDTNNTYLKVTPSTSASGAQGIGFVDASGEGLVFSGFSPDGLGDFKFDMYVEDTLDDGSPANIVGNRLRIGITSANNAQSKFLFIPLDGFPVNTWRRFTIPIRYIVNNGVGGSIDFGNVTRLLEFAIVGANLRFDNIGFACGGQPCGVVGEVKVFDDSVDPLWDRGIVGNDDFEKDRVPSNADYTDPNCCHVQWAEIETGDPDHETVIQTTFGNTGIIGAVNFIGADTPFPSIAALRDGEFRFDIKMISNPNDVELLFKIDANGGPGQFSSTGEQPLGQLPIGEWETFRCSIATLEAQGLDTTKITAPFVLVPGNRGSGQSVVVQWDNITFATESLGSATTLELPFIFDGLPGFCLPVAPFAGGAFALVNNPMPDAVNSNSTVGQVRKFDTGGSDATFGGISFQLSTPLEFTEVTSSVGKAFTIKTFSPRVGMPVSFKLEAGLRSLTRVFETTVANAWEDFTLDFNGTAENTFSGISIILDDGVVGDGSDDFRLELDEIIRIDSMSLVADLNSVYNFDAANTQYPLTDFDNARSKISSGPDGDPGNDGLVGEVFLGDFAATFAGTTIGSFEGFPTVIPFAPGRTDIQIRVWTPAAGTLVELKVEDATDRFQFDSDQQTTTGAGWQTLTFDFSDVDQMQTFEKLIIIFEPGIARTNKTFYWDDIELLP